MSSQYLYTINLPKFVGGYRLGGDVGLVVKLRKKPCWLHRTMMRLMLGWEWRDE